MDKNYSLIPAAMPKKVNAKALVFSIAALGSGFSSAGAVPSFDYQTPVETINILFEGAPDIESDSQKSHEIREYMLARLSHFFNNLNEEDWDEYGAYPIERQSYDNAVDVVNSTPAEVLELWNVFPSPNGTISFEFKAREVAAMSIGNRDFSYIARNKRSRKVVKDKRDFDARGAADALAMMNRHLGYL